MDCSFAQSLSSPLRSVIFILKYIIAIVRCKRLLSTCPLKPHQILCSAFDVWTNKLIVDRNVLFYHCLAVKHQTGNQKQCIARFILKHFEFPLLLRMWLSIVKISNNSTNVSIHIPSDQSAALNCIRLSASKAYWFCEKSLERNQMHQNTDRQLQWK